MIRAYRNLRERPKSAVDIFAKELINSLKLMWIVEDYEQGKLDKAILTPEQIEELDRLVEQKRKRKEERNK